MISKQLLQGRYTIIKDPTDPSQVMYVLISSIVIRLSVRSKLDKKIIRLQSYKRKSSSVGYVSIMRDLSETVTCVYLVYACNNHLK